MTIKETPNIITAILKVTVTAEFFDDEASEETVRYVIEQDLEDAGFDVDVAILKDQDSCENCAIAIEDRQPVVRCKDCKYWQQLYGDKPFYSSIGCCDCDDMWRSLDGETTEVNDIRTDSDFYCGYAERR